MGADPITASAVSGIIGLVGGSQAAKAAQQAAERNARAIEAAAATYSKRAASLAAPFFVDAKKSEVFSDYYRAKGMQKSPELGIMKERALSDVGRSGQVAAANIRGTYGADMGRGAGATMRAANATRKQQGDVTGAYYGMQQQYEKQNVDMAFREAQAGRQAGAQGAGIMNAAWGAEAQAGMSAASSRYAGDMEIANFDASMFGTVAGIGAGMLQNSAGFNDWLKGSKPSVPGAGLPQGSVATPQAPQYTPSSFGGVDPWDSGRDIPGTLGVSPSLNIEPADNPQSFQMPQYQQPQGPAPYNPNYVAPQGYSGSGSFYPTIPPVSVGPFAWSSFSRRRFK